ncbi:scarecrow transcription factor family protein [Dorcoceras hygrometricum]|uniref:Scarecrow transcription factor family protein n=1 Tax=Dorcoceras hygrometricum TaxID=472368 RepID=A0A2Z7BMY4_9LAMI|nr:scarecrow transcription factor family protein [Dorcoceras hygrometricum]
MKIDDGGPFVKGTGARGRSQRNNKINGSLISTPPPSSVQATTESAGATLSLYMPSTTDLQCNQISTNSALNCLSDRDFKASSKVAHKLGHAIGNSTTLLDQNDSYQISLALLRTVQRYRIRTTPIRSAQLYRSAQRYRISPTRTYQSNSTRSASCYRINPTRSDQTSSIRSESHPDQHRLINQHSLIPINTSQSSSTRPRSTTAQPKSAQPIFDLITQI